MVSSKAFKKHGHNKWTPDEDKWVQIKDFSNSKLKTYQKRGWTGRNARYTDRSTQIDINRIRRGKGVNHMRRGREARLKALQRQLYRSRIK